MKIATDILNIIIICALILLISSCTEEIDIDLNSSDPQTVIEGSISTSGEAAIIKITESVNFDESNTFPAVQNALVELSDDIGNYEVLSESSPGIYFSSEITGESGRKYTIKVQTANEQFAAACIIPERVAFDSLIVMESENSAGGPGGFGSSTNYDVKVIYSDPVNMANYYRFVEVINSEIEESYIFDDRLSDGLIVNNNLIRFNRKLDEGDTIQIIMQCIDKSVYDYFISFGNLMGGPQNSSTPANPESNIDGAALGYFSAHTYEIKEIVIQ